MLPYQNYAQLAGRLGRPPELSWSTDGSAHLRNILYYDHQYPGDQIDSAGTPPFQLSARGSVARAMHDQLRRGDRVLIQGRLRNTKFCYDGQTHVRCEICVESFTRIAPPRREVPTIDYPTPIATAHPN